MCVCVRVLVSSFVCVDDRFRIFLGSHLAFIISIIIIIIFNCMCVSLVRTDEWGKW